MLASQAFLIVSLNLGIFWLTLRWIRRDLRWSLTQRAPRAAILGRGVGVLRWGRGSGVSLIPGPGALVLTAEGLWFRRVAPLWELSVPLARVVSARAVPAPVGGLYGWGALELTYTQGDGRVAVVTWSVSGAADWVGAIEGARVYLGVGEE